MGPRTQDDNVTWSSPPPAARAGDTVQEPPGVKEQAYLRLLQYRTLSRSSLVPEVPWSNTLLIYFRIIPEVP